MSVFYKFKSGRDFNTVAFDGAFISLSELKQQIVTQKKLGKTVDYDLEITDASSNKVYQGSEPVPKNSSVIVRRVPIGGAKALSAPIEITPVISRKPVMTVQLNQESNNNEEETKPEPQQIKEENQPDEEAEAIANLISGSSSWSQTVAPMGTGKREHHNHGHNHTPHNNHGSHNSSEKVPHANYVCRRCLTPGHFINNCPTKPPIGIPKSMLTLLKQGEAGPGTLALPDGGFAKWTPNE